MIGTNLAFEVITDIPWERNPAFFGWAHDDLFIQALNKQPEEIPFGNHKIVFEDDLWDFNSIIGGMRSKDNQIRFYRATPNTKDMVKFYALNKITEGVKISTVSGRTCSILSVISNIEDNNPGKTVQTITTKDIVTEIEGRNIKQSTKYNLYSAIFQFYSFLKLNYQMEICVDLRAIAAKTKKNKKTAAAIERDKFATIPDEYCKAIVETSSSVMRSEGVPHNDRVVAATIVLLSQTGMRIGDLLILEEDSIFERKLPKSDVVTHYIHYKTQKPSKYYTDMCESDVFCNALCKDAVDILLSLREKVKRKYNIGKYLIAFDRIRKSREPSVPVSKELFNNRYKHFLYEYLREYTEKEWEGITPCYMYTYNMEKKKTEKTLVNVPDTRQFRVKVCSDLYNRGVPLLYIQRFMGHLSQIMMGYYVRPKDHSQENAEYTMKIIRDIEEEHIKLLGHDEGTVISRKIQEFISDNDFNVYTDVEEILKAMGDNIIIRGKEGGVCIKTSPIPCSKDARTNELLCASGQCPNLYHVYYMIDVTYSNYLSIKEAYLHNKSQGNEFESKKERNKIIYLLKNRLLPELAELERAVNEQGADCVIARHPELKNIIIAVDDINKEISQWNV